MTKTPLVNVLTKVGQVLVLVILVDAEEKDKWLILKKSVSDNLLIEEGKIRDEK